MSFPPFPAVSLILLYFARVLLISGLLYGYYRLCLQNAPFHGYNRNYLLGVIIGSLTMPLMPLPAGELFADSVNTATTGLLHGISTGAWEESLTPALHPSILQTFPVGQVLLVGGYLLVTAVFFVTLGLSLRYIFRLSARCPERRSRGLRIFMTREPGTPFSFLNRIFWDERLDLNSSTGRQVFRHELYHVRRRHSADLLALEIVRAVFWWNPFFHLIRKEIKATHEFLADQYAIGPNDKYEYAEILVWHAAGDPSPLVHSFFNTHLKRRIIMLTQSKDRRPGYVSRIMVLPLAFLLFCAFAVKLNHPNRSADRAPLKTITVVIDAGHGGLDPGAHSGDLQEKDLNLAIAKKIQQLSTAYNINVLMTREKDELPGNATTIKDGLDYRTDFANEHKADLFISIHVNNNGGAGNENGMEVWLSPQNAFFKKSRSLGSAMIEAMKKIYPTNDVLKQREEGIRVLINAKMPAILVECGFMDNEKDCAFIRNDQNQEDVAASILKGILHYEESQTPPVQ